MRVNRICLVGLVSFLVACGPAIKDLHNLQSSQEQQNGRLDALEQQVEFLQAQVSTFKSIASGIQTAISADMAAIAALQADNSAQQAQIDALQAAVTSNTAAIESIQEAVTDNLVAITQLQGYANITEIVDPCGDSAGKVDEVLLRLANGQLLASYSDAANGLNTRFAMLQSGTYSTTDGTSCVFTVQANGQVTW